MWVYREHKSHLLQVWLLFLSDTVHNVWVFKSQILLKYLSIFIPIFLSAFFSFHWISLAPSLLSSDWDILTRKSKTHLFGLCYSKAKFLLSALLWPTWPAHTLVITRRFGTLLRYPISFCGLSYIPGFSQGEVWRRATFEHQDSLNCGCWITLLLRLIRPMRYFPIKI